MDPSREVRRHATLYVLLIAAAVVAWGPRVLPVLDRWRDARRLQRTVAILYTTDTRGFLESCGCGGPERAGLAYRHAFLIAQRYHRPQSLLVDNGNISDLPEKLPSVLQTMRLDGYDAVGTGELDTALGEVYAAEARRTGAPLVRALPRGDALDALTRPLRLKRLQGRILGVTSLAPPPPGVPWEHYLGQATAALRNLRQQCDLLVLLSQLGRSRDEELARRCGALGPQVIIGNLQAQSLPAPLQVGGSVLVPTGPGGRSVGVAEVLFSQDGTPRLGSVSVVPARTEGPPDGQVVRIVRDYYQEARQRFLATFDTRLLAAEMADGAGDVVRCGQCHANQAQSWLATGHARAVDTLIRRGRLVPECLACHSTRFRHTGVFDHAARAGDVDCTACHPRASNGAESRCPDRAMPTRGVATCTPCHTKEQSPAFRYDAYLPRVVHRGRE